MEQPVHELHLHVHLDERLRDGRGVHAGGVEPVHPRPVNELHDEHALPHHVRDDDGDLDPRVAAEVLADGRGILGLEAEVHFLAYPRLEGRQMQMVLAPR